MTSPAIRTGSFALGFLAHYGMMAVCGLPYWSQSNWQISNPLYGRIPTFNGIWWQCMSLKTGGFSCNHYGKPTIYLDADIQACRALMCIACIFSFLAVIIALLGLDCTTMVENGSKSKGRVSLVAGVFFLIAADLQAQRALMVIAIMMSLFGLIIGMVSLRCTTMLDNENRSKSIVGIVSGTCFLLAGVTCGAAVSWYAWRVTMEFFNPLYQQREFKYEYGACLYAGWVSMALGLCTLTTTIWYGVQVQQDYFDPAQQSNSFKYEFGSCLYIGWICGGITLIAGLLLTCGSCGNLRSEADDSYPYSYKPQPNPSSRPRDVSGSKTEYV